ncbi:hypothetical protein G443_000041 [Actinoalloteichus cyanogriseus DSM 43889]|uniref:Basic proline-rich protein n=1 Tax=Actinoalloteichus caeruleus DSM 43889 TaxID=1120930 RepID=A0ABT1JDA5_ACTCY|nr:hypothetical protein [Actinoalloteichus caeruleus DSM 43889]
MTGRTAGAPRLGRPGPVSTATCASHPRSGVDAPARRHPHPAAHAPDNPAPTRANEWATGPRTTSHSRERLRRKRRFISHSGNARSFWITSGCSPEFAARSVSAADKKTGGTGVAPPSASRGLPTTTTRATCHGPYSRARPAAVRIPPPREAHVPLASARPGRDSVERPRATGRLPTRTATDGVGGPTRVAARGTRRSLPAAPPVRTTGARVLFARPGSLLVVPALPPRFPRGDATSRRGDRGRAQAHEHRVPTARRRCPAGQVHPLPDEPSEDAVTLVLVVGSPEPPQWFPVPGGPPGAGLPGSWRPAGRAGSRGRPARRTPPSPPAPDRRARPR